MYICKSERIIKKLLSQALSMSFRRLVTTWN